MILDFGCGDGRRWNTNDDVVGIDVNFHRLELANKKISAIQCDGRFLPFRSSVFSSVLCDSVLEHIPDFERALAEIGRVLTVGGACRIWQPVDNDPFFFVARRVARAWKGDKVYSKFSSGYLLRQMSESFRIISVHYLPNSPIVGILGFFNKKTPRVLSILDGLYKMFSQTTGIFHWEVVIEASVPPSAEITN
jgi:ubiquinone/menaquinone biosynthesis C-methylase UbiE